MEKIPKDLDEWIEFWEGKCKEMQERVKTERLSLVDVMRPYQYLSMFQNLKLETEIYKFENNGKENSNNTNDSSREI